MKTPLNLDKLKSLISDVESIIKSKNYKYNDESFNVKEMEALVSKLEEDSYCDDIDSYAQTGLNTDNLSEESDGSISNNNTITPNESTRDITEDSCQNNDLIELCDSMNLKNNLKELYDLIIDYNKKVFNLIEEYNSCNNDNIDLNELLGELHNELDTRNQTITKYKDDFVLLKEHIIELESKIKNQVSNDQLSQENESLRSTIIELKSITEKLGKFVEKLSSDKIKLERSNMESETKIEECLNVIEEQKKMINENTNKIIQIKDAEIKKLNDIIDKKKRDYQELEEECKGLSKKYDQSFIENSRLTNLTKSMKDNELKLKSKLEDENTQLTLQVNELRMLLKRKDEELGDKDERIDKLNRNNKESINNINHLKEKMSNLTEKHDEDIKKLVKEYEIKINEERDKINEEKDKINEEKKIFMLEKKLTEENIKETDSNIPIIDNSDDNKNLNELKSELKSELAEFRKKNLLLQNECDYFKKILKEQEDKVGDIYGHCSKEFTNCKTLVKEIIERVSEGNLKCDMKFLRMIKNTIKKMESYEDPIICKMTVQFVLCMRYVEDIVDIKKKIKEEYSQINL